MSQPSYSELGIYMDYYNNRKTPFSVRYLYNCNNTLLYLHCAIFQSLVSSSNLRSLFLPECGNWLQGHAFDLCFPKLNGLKVILKYLAIQSTEWKIWTVPVFNIHFQIYHRDYFLKFSPLLPLLHNAWYCTLLRRDKQRNTGISDTDSVLCGFVGNTFCG